MLILIHDLQRTFNGISVDTIIPYECFGMIKPFVPEAKAKETIDTQIAAPIIRMDNRTFGYVVLDDL